MQKKPNISWLAANCRKQAKSKLKDIRVTAYAMLGVTRIPASLPKEIQAEMVRQAKLRSYRTSTRVVPAIRMVDRWLHTKMVRAQHRIFDVLTRYGSISTSDGEHDVEVMWGRPSVAVTKSFGHWKKYGRDNYRVFNFETAITVPSDWRTQIKMIGTDLVEDHLVLAVYEPLTPSNPADLAYRAEILRKGVGLQLRVEEVAIHRSPGEEWRIGKLPRATRYQVILGEQPKTRKPSRRKTQNAVAP